MGLARIMSAILAACLLAAGGCGGGLLATTTGAGIGALTTRSALNKVDDIVQTTMANARITGDALSAKAAADLQHASQNTVLLLSAKLDEQVDRLEVTQRNLVQQLHEKAERLKSAGRLLDTWRADAAIDLMEIVGQVPLTRDVNFYVARVEGVTYFRTEGDLAVTFQGIGIADQSSTRVARIQRVMLDGVAVEHQIRRINNTTATVVVPAQALPPSSDPNKLTFPQMTFVSEVTTQSFWGTKRSDYSFHTTLTFVPENIGIGTVVYEEAAMGWVSAARGQEAAVTTNYHDYPKSWIPYTVELAAPAGQRIAPGSVSWQVSFEDALGRAPWTTFELATSDPRYPKIRYTDGGTKAVLNFHAWGKPVKVWLTGNFEEHRQTGTSEVSKPIVVSANALTRCSIPKSALTWRLDARLVDGTTVTMRRGETHPRVTATETIAGDRIDLSLAFQGLR